MDDASAIARCRAGDTAAFGHLVERYERELYAHALAITRSPALAHDAVQEGLLDAWRHLDRFDLERRFYPWVYTLVRNRCLKLLGARRGGDVSAGVELLVAPPAATDARLDLERGLAALTPADRELLVLKELDGLTYAEIAELLAIPAGTVMSRLFHARGRLREAMRDPPPRRRSEP